MFILLLYFFPELIIINVYINLVYVQFISNTFPEIFTC
jgi:hypothetical protein